MLRALILFLLPIPALADPPRVVADIPPVHSLVASVMKRIGTPELLVPANASPHGYALRPRQARALDQAELVFWVGPELTPWLDRSLSTLGETATRIALLDAPGTKRLKYGQGSARHNHGDHDGFDPHAWLDPANGRAWVLAIAEALAAADPGNAEGYRRNAKDAAERIKATASRIKSDLDPIRKRSFVVYHDGYRYFQTANGLSPLGVVAHGDAVKPGAGRLTSLQQLIKTKTGTCVFLEPQIPARAVAGLLEGTSARTGVLDPLGASIEPGPELYLAVLSGIAASMQDCLGK